MNIEKELFSLQDLGYKAFHEKLIPSVNPDTVIGVRTPALKKLAKVLNGEKDDCNAFLDSLPHKYYEENNLHAFVLNNIKDFDECIRRIDEFLPYVDNWATCDGLRPLCFAKNRDKLLCFIDKWLCDTKTYTVRFGIEMLMVHFLDDGFDVKYHRKVATIVSDEYYVNMMIAWYFATALAKKWDKTAVFLQNNSLPLWVHNKTVQKAVESYRITHEQKQYLKSIRRKI